MTGRVGTNACAAAGARPSTASVSMRSASAAVGRPAGSFRSSAVITGASGPACPASSASSVTTACMVQIGDERRNGDAPWTAV